MIRKILSTFSRRRPVVAQPMLLIEGPRVTDVIPYEEDLSIVLTCLFRIMDGATAASAEAVARASAACKALDNLSLTSLT